MGADMIYTAVRFKEGQDILKAKEEMLQIAKTLTVKGEHWGKLEHFLDKIMGLDSEELNEEEVRGLVSESIIDGFEPLIEGSRQVATMAVGGLVIYLTGGLSFGDDPTDVFETMRRLGYLRYALEPESDEDETFTMMCPYCLNNKEDGHAPNCEREK